MLSEEEAHCQNPDCGKPITIVPGHRRRQYCDDACKQAALRARAKAARLAAEEAARLARIAQERQEVLKRWGNLLPETVDLLHSLRGTSWEEQIVMAIRAEQEWVRKALTQERNTLLEEMMLLGEQLDYPTLINDDFKLDAGTENWLIFCEKAELASVYQARDIAHIKIRAQGGRKRLAQLSPQSFR
jgi:hypothetical protein